MKAKIVAEYWDPDSHPEFESPSDQTFLVLEKDGIRQKNGSKITMSFVQLDDKDGILELSHKFHDKIVSIIRAAENESIGECLLIKIILRTEAELPGSHHCFINFAMGITKEFPVEEDSDKTDAVNKRSFIIERLPSSITEDYIKECESTKLVRQVLLS